MTEPDAKVIVNRMTKLWVDWDPTTELITLWVGVLTPFDRDVAWTAIELSYGHAHWKTPKPSNFQKEVNVLLGGRNQGVHCGNLPVISPFFILEKEVTGARKRRRTRPPQKAEYVVDDKGERRRKPMIYTDCEVRYFTWAFPDGLPAEEIILQRARGMLTLTEYLYGGGWIIADARSPAADASDYVKQLSWRLTDKAPSIRGEPAPEAPDENPIPF